MHFRLGRPTFRSIVANAFSNISYTPKEGRLEYEDYIKDIKRSKFVLAPPGNGEDTIRLWESMFFGAIPIIRNDSGLWPLYKRLPVLILEDSEWRTGVPEERLLNFDIGLEKEKIGRKFLLAQKWFNIFDRFREDPNVKPEGVKPLYELALRQEFELS